MLVVVLSTLPAIPPPAATTSAMVGGEATWYCDPPASHCTVGYPAGSMVAAAGSELQHEGWRGSWVVVRHGGRSVRVQLVDVCLCRGRRVIDLYAVAFRQLAPTSAGVIEVEVELDAGAGDPGPAVTLPPTDTAP